MIDLRLGDCLEVMAGMADNSVDLIATDPPYFKVKSEWWDRQWDKPETFLEWIGQLCQEWRRILKPNGSLYLFAWWRYARQVSNVIAQHFSIVNEIVWVKHDGTENRGGQWSKARKEDLRSYFPQTERIIFAEHYGADSYAMGSAGYSLQCDRLRGFVFEPLRLYLRGEWERAGLTPDDANLACGTVSMAGRHFFSRSQWCLPTAEHYAALQRYANEKGRRPAPPYAEHHGAPRARFEPGKNGAGASAGPEYLRADYEDLRRPFLASPERPYTDVWEFPTVPGFPGKHPAEKPVALMEHIVLISSRPGAVVLDCFMGRGATAVACRNAGRRFVGIDKAEKWVRATERRLVEDKAQLSFLEGAQGETGGPAPVQLGLALASQGRENT